MKNNRQKAKEVIGVLPVCDCCGRVFDISEPLVDTETLERMEAEHGFTITKEDLLFGGVCAECKEKSKNKTA